MKDRRATGVAAALATCLFFLTSPALQAGSPQSDPIIISVTSPPGLSTLVGLPLATSWSQSKSYSGVSISILVDAAIVGRTPTVDAFLTTRTGPGTTSADEIAHTQFTVPSTLPVCSPNSCGAMVTLFSDLTLGPGNYFLTLSPGDTSMGEAGWFPAVPPTVSLDTGVSEGPSFRASTAASYPPASDFGPMENAMNITVTGSGTFAGVPGTPNCHGQSVSALARQFGGLGSAASALGFAGVPALQDAISVFCHGM